MILPTRPQDSADKAAWRAWAAGVRAGLPDASAVVAAHLSAFLRGRGARRVLAYHALPGEPDLGVLASEWGGEFELYTTRTHFRPARHLTVHPWATATERTRAGYLQPPADAPQVPLTAMDAALLPGLAYDRRGVRLGYGGGFYDRLLPGFAGLTVGVTRAALLAAHLPAEPHDVRVAWLATEDGVTPAK